MNSNHTPLSAFQNSAQVRKAASDKLQQHLVNQTLTQGLFEWQDDHGSPAGALIESADPTVWIQTLGLPGWMPLAIDTLTSQLDRATAVDKVEAMLDAVAPGVDIGGKGAQIIIWTLDDAREQFEGQDVPAELVQALEHIRALHQLSLTDQAVEPSLWRQARKFVLDRTKGLDEYDPFFTLATTIEAACWNPQTSQTVLGEVMRTRFEVEMLKADAAFGWSEEEFNLIQKTLDDLYNKHDCANTESTRDVFSYLAEEYPELDERARAHIAFPAKFAVVCADKLSDQFIKMLHNIR